MPSSGWVAPSSHPTERNDMDAVLAGQAITGLGIGMIVGLVVRGVRILFWGDWNS
jgi:hypothetical protein